MGRTKQYDRNELLDLAVELFRKQGFNGTSTAELVAELGVNRKSMYAEFGSKQGLFEAALQRYNAKNLTYVLGPLEAEDASIDAIQSAFDGYASAAEGPYRGLGCLMANTAVERAALDPASGRYVAAYLERITVAFRAALRNAQQTEDLDASADIDELADFFTTALVGVAACVRAKAPASQVKTAARLATRVLDSVRP